MSYLIANDGIVKNNLQFELGRGGYLPNDSATSESQLLLIRGYARAYLATHKAAYLVQAQKFADAYIDAFCQGDIDNAHHWVVNGGDPLALQGPPGSIPQFDGVVGASVSFTAGVAHL